METVVSVFEHVPNRIGGIERFAHQLSLSLAGAGNRSVLAFAGSPPSAVHKFLESSGAIIEAPPAGIFRSPGSVQSVNSLIRRYSADVIHLHFGGVLTPAPWLAWLHGTRTFLTVHDSFPAGQTPAPIPAWKQLASRAILYPVHAVFAVSEFSAKYVRMRGWFRADHVYAHPNAVLLPDLSRKLALRQSWRSKWGIGDDAFLVSSVSHMIPEKGIDVLIDAFPSILHQFPNARLALVGDGAGVPRFRERVQSLGIESEVIFTGHDPDPSGNGAFDAADVFCAPSLWQEAFGFSIAEALSHAVPVVATNVGAIPELVLDEVTGLLIEPGSAAALSGAVTRLLASPALRIRLAYAGRRHMEYNFDLVTSCEALLHRYGVTQPERAQVRASAATTASVS